jgi:hypothetical protein
MNTFELNDIEGDFSITLGPGVVKYFSTENFFEANIDDVISKLNSLPGKFRLKIAHTDIDNLFLTDSWEQKLRTCHALDHFCASKGLTPAAYSEFHKLLRLKEFAFEECLNSWIQNVEASEVVYDSYRNSTQHIVVTHERETRIGRKNYIVSDVFIFAKTPFVIEKLKTLERAAADKTAAVELELLRKSKFDCFVYLMEDLRNKTFKIGKSKTPGKRERTLQSEVPQIVMRFSIPVDEAHEKQLHDRFSEKRKRGEWFELSSDDVAWIVAYLKTNGDASRAIIDYQWLGAISFSASSNPTMQSENS